MHENGKSVFDTDTDTGTNKAEDMNTIDPAVETQFDTADIVFALTRIEHSVNMLGITVAFGVGVLMAAIYWQTKR